MIFISLPYLFHAFCFLGGNLVLIVSVILPVIIASQPLPPSFRLRYHQSFRYTVSAPTTSDYAPDTGGKGSLTQWVHCEFVVSFEAIHPVITQQV